MKYIFKKGFETRLALGPIHSLSNSVARAFSCLFSKHFLQNYVDYTNYISAFHSSPVKRLVAAFWLSSTSEGRARDPVGAVQTPLWIMSFETINYKRSDGYPSICRQILYAKSYTRR